jgi:hypothetical protein
MPNVPSGPVDNKVGNFQRTATPQPVGGQPASSTPPPSKGKLWPRKDKK